MKRLALSIIAIVAALTMVLSISGCGLSPEERLNNYIASDEFQSQLNTLKKSYESVLDIEVRSEGSTLVMDYIYVNQYDETTVKAMEEALDTAMKSGTETFEAMADSLKKTGIEDPYVAINVKNHDGTVISSYEFGTSE